MYVIRGKLKGMDSEDIDEFETKKEAESMLYEYALAYGSGWKLWIVYRKS